MTARARPPESAPTNPVEAPPQGTGVPPATPSTRHPTAPIAILGVPFDKISTSESLSLIEQMIASGRPHYAATANVDFVVQASHDVELRRILGDADLVLCDGMPLLWASRLLGNPLPERVAGSDLVPLLLADAELKGWRIFFLGGSEDSLARAAENVRARHPRLQLVGAYSPPFKPLLEMDHADIVRRVRDARPDILLVAFGCPKQEKWISMQFRNTGVPLSIGVGATIDFLAGSVRRAPVWMQRTGLEWVFRLLQEPRRLFRRYVTDFWVFGRAILRQAWQLRTTRPCRQTQPPSQAPSQPNASDNNDNAHFEELSLDGCFDAATARQHSVLWTRLTAGRKHVLLNLSGLKFIDSTGVGMLVRLQKNLTAAGRQLVLVAPALCVTRALNLMRLNEFIPAADSLDAARDLIRRRLTEESVVTTDTTDTVTTAGPNTQHLAWQGDIVAANAEDVWRMTQPHIANPGGIQSVLNIDLSAVRFIDSTGVSLMVRVRKEAQKNGVQARFSQPRPAVLNVLRMLRMETHLLG